MKDFIEELMYMCSASNTKSRGFYIGITVMLALMLIAMPVMLVLLIVNYVKFKAFQVLWLVLFFLVLIIFVGVIIWLKKSR